MHIYKSTAKDFEALWSCSSDNIYLTLNKDLVHPNEYGMSFGCIGRFSKAKLPSNWWHDDLWMTSTQLLKLLKICENIWEALLKAKNFSENELIYEDYIYCECISRCKTVFVYLFKDGTIIFKKYSSIPDKYPSEVSITYDSEAFRKLEIVLKEEILELDKSE